MKCVAHQYPLFQRFGSVTAPKARGQSKTLQTQ
jgi:hypothetical protein